MVGGLDNYANLVQSSRESSMLVHVGSCDFRRSVSTCFDDLSYKSSSQRFHSSFHSSFITLHLYTCMGGLMGNTTLIGLPKRILAGDSEVLGSGVLRNCKIALVKFSESILPFSDTLSCRRCLRAFTATSARPFGWDGKQTIAYDTLPTSWESPLNLMLEILVLEMWQKIFSMPELGLWIQQL